MVIMIMDKDSLELSKRLKQNTQLYIGYPPATDFLHQDYAELLNYSINNLGDPFDMGNPFSTQNYEKAVIEFFLKMYDLSVSEYWGYVANCSSEAVLYCVWKARDHLRESICGEIKVIASKYSHYCIDKVANIVDLPCQRLPSLPTGEIDLVKLEAWMAEDAAKGYVFFATIGSTMTSSIDDIQAVRGIAKRYGKALYVHADAAFDGAFLPFTNALAHYQNFDSINISGHKFIGMSMPCGVFLIKRDYLKSVYIEYVNNEDVTLAGSRNGLLGYLLYQQIKALGGLNGLKNRYFECLHRAEAFCQKLNNAGISTWKNPYALTVVLEKIAPEIMQKWHAPSYQNITTLTVLPKFSEAQLDAFIADVISWRETGKFDQSMMTVYPQDVEAL